MPDVGDKRRPTLTVAPYDGSTTASVVIVAPDGTTAATLSATGVGGTYTAESSYTFTAEGVWVERWTVTGTGAGVEFEFVIAVGIAEPVELPPALASIGHLVARLGRSLTATEKAKAPGLLADASDAVRDYCRRPFAVASDAEVLLRPIGNKLQLRMGPILSISQVEQIGTSGTADRVMAADEWEFDGIDTIILWPWIGRYGVIGSYANTYRVTYSSTGVVPSTIVRRVVAVTLRHMLTPSPVRNMVSERVGQYQYQLGQFAGGGSPGVTVELSDEDKTALREAGYRPTAGTIQLRT